MKYFKERKDRAQGVDIQELLRKGAKELLKAREQQLREVTEVREENFSIVVMQRKLSDEPTYLWTPVTLPLDLPTFTVRASLREAIRNKESLHDLMCRRLRRGIRDRLLAAKVMPEQLALEKVLKTQVTVIDDVGLIL